VGWAYFQRGRISGTLQLSLSNSVHVHSWNLPQHNESSVLTFIVELPWSCMNHTACDMALNWCTAHHLSTPSDNIWIAQCEHVMWRTDGMVFQWYSPFNITDSLFTQLESTRWHLFSLNRFYHYANGSHNARVQATVRYLLFQSSLIK